MPRYIRYLENGEYKYASVKPVGDISLLKIDAPDLVTAINSLVEGGVIELVQEDLDRITGDVDGLQGNLDSVDKAVQYQAETIASQQQLIDAVQQRAEDLKKEAEDLLNSQKVLQQQQEDLVREANLTKADLENTKSEMQKKLDFAQYQEQYAQLVEQVEQKANNIDIESIVDSVNQDIADQTREIDNAKTGIVNLDSKVNTVKGELSDTIDGVNRDVDDLDTRVAQQKQDLVNQIGQVQTTANENLNTAKQELNASIASIKGETTAIQDELDSTKQEILDTKDKLDETESSLLETKTELDSVKNNIVYKVEIYSTNGNVFKNGQFGTTLEARVYKGVKDVTNEFNASKFRWTRVSTDQAGDIAWNTAHAGGSKSVVITPEDIKGRATFNCEVLE